MRVSRIIIGDAPIKERISSAFIVAARTMAAAVVLYLFPYLLGLVYIAASSIIYPQRLSSLAPRFWLHLDTFLFLAFYGYALFTLLPIRRLSPRRFKIAVVVGSVLALGSIWPIPEIYGDFVHYGEVRYHLMLWVLIIPVYAYIPMVIWQRRLKATREKQAPLV